MGSSRTKLCHQEKLKSDAMNLAEQKITNLLKEVNRLKGENLQLIGANSQIKSQVSRKF